MISCCFHKERKHFVSYSSFHYFHDEKKNSVGNNAYRQFVHEQAARRTSGRWRRQNSSGARWRRRRKPHPELPLHVARVESEALKLLPASRSKRSRLHQKHEFPVANIPAQLWRRGGEVHFTFKIRPRRGVGLPRRAIWNGERNNRSLLSSNYSLTQREIEGVGIFLNGHYSKLAPHEQVDCLRKDCLIRVLSCGTTCYLKVL